MWHPKQPGPDVQVSLCTEHCHGTRHSWPLSSEANGMIDVKRVIAKQWAVPERCLGISGRGLWSWTTLRFQLAGVSPVNSMNAAPPLSCTYDTVNGDGHPAQLLEGLRTGKAAGEGGGHRAELQPPRVSSCSTACSKGRMSSAAYQLHQAPTALTWWPLQAHLLSLLLNLTRLEIIALILLILIVHQDVFISGFSLS